MAKTTRRTLSDRLRELMDAVKEALSPRQPAPRTGSRARNAAPPLNRILYRSQLITVSSGGTARIDPAIRPLCPFPLGPGISHGPFLFVLTWERKED